MTRLSKLFILLTILCMLMSCGNRKSPTGGREDKEQPVIVSVIPEEYSNIMGQNIEITFSKPIDRSSIYEGERGIHFYPFISDKRFRWSDNTLIIEINEELEPDRNYYLTLSEQIRDLRRNHLEKSYLLVFHTGTLMNKRVFGDIRYEREVDLGLPVNITLFSADTLRIFTKQVTGSKFLIENLESKDYFLRAFIDKNRNRRFDIGNDPFYETVFHAEKSPEIELYLEYFDDTKPEIQSLRAEYEHLLTLIFNKPVISVSDIEISVVQEETDSLNTSADTLFTRLLIRDYDILDNKLEIITASMDSLDYTVKVFEVEDHKENIAAELKKEFRGSIRRDRSKPLIISTIPRNGAVVDNLFPDLQIEFDKFMDMSSLDILLVDSITSGSVPVSIDIVNSRIIKVQPKEMLQNRTPYRLEISESTQDMAGNSLEEDFVLQFLPISGN